MGKASRDKGKRGELEARDVVRETWSSPDCVRSAQVSGTFAADLMGGPPGLHLEVKRYRRIAAYDFVTQASGDAVEGDLPVVLMRQDQGDWVVMVRMADSVDFARRLLDVVDRDEDSVPEVRE